MDRADVRVIQGGSRSGLAAETIRGLRVTSQFAGQKLESDKTVQPGVLSLVDHPHPACAQFLDYPVVGDGPADQRIGALPRVVAMLPGDGARGHFDGRTLQETSCLHL